MHDTKLASDDYWRSLRDTAAPGDVFAPFVFPDDAITDDYPWGVPDDSHPASLDDVYIIGRRTRALFLYEIGRFAWFLPILTPESCPDETDFYRTFNRATDEPRRFFALPQSAYLETPALISLIQPFVYHRNVATLMTPERIGSLAEPVLLSVRTLFVATLTS